MPSWNSRNNSVDILTSEYYLNNIKPNVLNDTDYIKCYPNSNIPDYAVVTDEILLETETSGKIRTYIYQFSDKVLDYSEYLIEKGWELFDTDKEEDYTSYYVVKDGEMLDITVMYSHNQIWISY